MTAIQHPFKDVLPAGLIILLNVVRMTNFECHSQNDHGVLRSVADILCQTQFQRYKTLYVLHNIISVNETYEWDCPKGCLMAHS